MSDHCIAPELLIQCAGDPPNAFAGVGKIVMCQNTATVCFGGVLKDNKRLPHQDWEMQVGTLLFVPARRFRWADNGGLCGWELSDILTQGLKPQYWKEFT